MQALSIFGKRSAKATNLLQKSSSCCLLYTYIYVHYIRIKIVKHKIKSVLCVALRALVIRDGVGVVVKWKIC